MEKLKSLNIRTATIWLYFLLIGILLALFINRKNFVLNNIENIGNNSTTPSKIELAVFIILVLVICLYSVFYNLKLKYSKSIVLATLIFMLILTFCLPIFSVDIGAYLISAKNLIFYHTNPYLAPLNYYSQDSWVIYMGSTWWMKYPSLYGPLALLISSISVAISSFSFIVAIYIYKFFVLLAVIMSVHLFKKLDASMNKVNTLLFMLNPILLISILLDGHNDAFILLSSLAYFYYLKQNKIVSSYLTFLGGVFIKYLNIIIFPSLFIKGKKFYWIRLLLSGILMFLSMYAFTSIFHITLNDFLNNKALAINNMCVYVCTPLIAVISIFGKYQTIIRLGLFAIAYSWITIKYLYLSYHVYKFTFWAFICLFFVFSVTYLPWYGIYPITVGLLINEKKYTIFTLVLTAYSLLFYFGI